MGSEVSVKWRLFELGFCLQFSAEGPTHPGTGEGDQHQWWWGWKKQQGKSSVEGSARRSQWCRESNLERGHVQGEKWVKVPLTNAYTCSCQGWQAHGQYEQTLGSILWAGDPGSPWCSCGHPVEWRGNSYFRTVHTATLSTRFQLIYEIGCGFRGRKSSSW